MLAQDKVLKLTPEEAKAALIVGLNVIGRGKLSREDCDIHFAKDGNSTRVDEISIWIKVDSEVKPK